ncbi:MAG: hypothetical protein K2N55_05065 [Lachnospiraceae bacterium]|nr:hypothetical protein [Lachnospiraceae bacterium]
MKVKGFFCVTTAKTNEEYREVLKKRNIRFTVLALAGALIAGVTLYAEESQVSALPDYIMGVYCGFGTGIFLAGILLLVKNLILMRSEEKLKQSRLENADERYNEINKHAARITLMVMVFTIIVGGMIGGIFEPALVKATVFLVDVFAISYITAFTYYKRKM